MYKQLIKRTKETIEHIELARINAYKDLVHYESYNPVETGIRVSDRLPKCNMELFEDNGYPVFFLSYEGMLPMYSESKKYKSEIRDYYIQVTAQAFDWACLTDIQFERATIFIVHYFGDTIIRDLDNRNRKHIIDGIKIATGIIEDDSWDYIEVIEMGARESKGKYHVDVYILETENFVEFYKEFKKNLQKSGENFDGNIQKTPKKRVTRLPIHTPPRNDKNEKGLNDTKKAEEDEFF